MGYATTGDILPSLTYPSLLGCRELGKDKKGTGDSGQGNSPFQLAYTLEYALVFMLCFGQTPGQMPIIGQCLSTNHELLIPSLALGDCSATTAFVECFLESHFNYSYTKYPLSRKAKGINSKG
jgi:hypothetical protein